MAKSSKVIFRTEKFFYMGMSEPNPPGHGP